MKSVLWFYFYIGLLCEFTHNYLAALEITFVNNYNTPGQLFIGGRVRTRPNRSNQPQKLINPKSFFLPNNVDGQNNRKTITLPDDWVGEFWAGTDCNPNTYKCALGQCDNAPNCRVAPQHTITFISFETQPEMNRTKYSINNVYGMNHVYRVETINGAGPKCGTLECDYDENAKCPEGYNVGNGQKNRILYGCKTPCSLYFWRDACCRNGKCGKYTKDLSVFSRLCPAAKHLDTDKNFNLCTANKFRIIIGKPMNPRAQ